MSSLEQFINGCVKSVGMNDVGCIPSGTMVYYDEIEILEEQEKEMSMKVFEYCITDFNDVGDAVVLVGPELIVIEAEDNQANLALLRIGQRHADIITPESTVLVRPFC